MDHIVSVQTSYQTISGTRKEKKKQGKDELDRLRQAEKKKRRLEKALATSAAIRSELEKKKQKKKEEQQRLDEEGAAIAEAVALHVLVDEDSDEAAEVVSNKDREIGLRQSAQLGFVPWNSVAGAGNIGLYFGGRRKDTLCQNGAKGWGSIKYSLGSDSRERILDSREAEWQQNEWDPLHRRSSSRANRDNLEINGRLLGFGGGCSQWENLSLVNQKRTICDERVRAAEMPAGLAAAEAVAALQIVEEAQAEAKAVQTAAETTINGSLDRRSLAHKFHFLDECKVKSRNTEERDLRRTQLQETKVPDLEHSLNEVTRHFLDFKAKIEGSRSWKLYWLSSS